MGYRVVVIEVEGGSDKWIDGHRKDTMPIIESLRDLGVDADVRYYRPDWKDQLVEDLVGWCDGYISRVNPGNLPGGEADYFDFLRQLSEAGMVGMSHPDQMLTFGAKDALVKLADTDLVPDDTYAYYDVETLHSTFPTSLSYGERVLKQKPWIHGEGIWRVQVVDTETTPGTPLPLDTKLRCTEAVDNHQDDFLLGDFLTFCEQYVIGDNGMLVDMRFMPRIVEGEIRILLIGMTPVFVVHKKPADVEGAFSATLFSGAQYTYDPPEKWAELIDMFNREFAQVRDRLGDFDIPLIWTADFMLDTKADGTDAYVLGEFNCSCVGFTSHLDQGIQEVVAKEVLSRLVKNGEPVRTASDEDSRVGERSYA